MIITYVKSPLLPYQISLARKFSILVTVRNKPLEAKDQGSQIMVEVHFIWQ